CLPGQIPALRRKHPQQRADPSGAIDDDQTGAALGGHLVRNHDPRLVYPGLVCIVSPDNHQSDPYEFGVNTTFSICEATAVTERPGWRDAARGDGARAPGAISTSGAGAVSVPDALFGS